MLRVVGSQKSVTVSIVPKPLLAWKVCVSKGDNKPEWINGFVSHGCLQLLGDPCSVASPGDWIVRDSFGTLHVVTEDEFRDSFVEAEETVCDSDQK
jgi:hypothetical protein